ncbi:2-nitropropane dioxygenase [Fictibacillus macauensis ZFHKF-1]|uniref:Probable nitronate monooxygenase n=1 Tax=Fictibacillus macauensis ZFHKF-1 TaxID=1196324 RepID=I8UG53_9BACL|nr:nitronate monooxygenase [Fictibacillus macauensis]EIT85813.1 2-nitropropane dioxygenase [Fictibacillus macauensis ZFHKF-1]
MKTLCELLNIDVPILQGGMGNGSNAPLTAAISNAGGLGTIGVGTRSPQEIEALILETKALTNKPFAVNVPLTVASSIKEIMALIVSHSIPIVSLSAGNPAPFIPKLKAHGIVVICVVASVYHAKKAEEAGADVIVAEGYEAAGLNSPLETTTMTLVPQVTSAVSVPVVAAGGVADGRGLAASMMLGAQGVQIGTRFIAVQESPFHAVYKEALLEASDQDTVVVGRSVGRIRRVMKAPYAQTLLHYEKEGVTLEQFNELTTETHHLKGAMDGNLQEGFINSGQIAGLITSIPTARELMTTMMDEASYAIEQSFQTFHSFKNKEESC